MRVAAVVCNLLLCASVGLLVVNEGMPSQTAYMLFTLLALIVPILSAAVILRRGSGPSRQRSFLDWATGVLNVLLLALTVWAVISQYPYPEGNSVLLFALLMLVAPILSLVVLFGAHGWTGYGLAPQQDDP